MDHGRVGRGVAEGVEHGVGVVQQQVGELGVRSCNRFQTFLGC